MTDGQEKKDELLRILDSVPNNSDLVIDLGREMIQTGQLTRDIAAQRREIVFQTPPESFLSGQIDREIEGWQAWTELAKQVQESHTLVNSFGAMASGVINTTISNVIVGYPPSPLSVPVQQARTKLFQVVDRSPSLQKVQASMKRLRLDVGGGTARPAPDLLEEAVGALERPVIHDGAPTSVLIPLRECIDASITELIRRRPVQAKVSGWSGKVSSLGQHCGQPGLTVGHFDRLGVQADTVMNRLSGFKQQNIPRDQINEYFLEAVTFLDALLGSIDESKLR